MWEAFMGEREQNKSGYDEIRIDNLEIFAHHGVFPEEKEKGQLFYINAVLYGDLRQAGKCDDLKLSTQLRLSGRFLT